MPEESVAAYINNTVTFVIFILICMIVFALIYFVSKALRKKVLARNQRRSRIDIDVEEGGNGFKKTGAGAGPQSIPVVDPFIRKNIILLGIIFIFMILSLILALAVFYYSWNMGINAGLYLMGAVLIGFVVMLVYIIRSGTIN